MPGMYVCVHLGFPDCLRLGCLFFDDQDECCVACCAGGRGRVGQHGHAAVYIGSATDAVGHGSTALFYNRVEINTQPIFFMEVR